MQRDPPRDHHDLELHADDSLVVPRETVAAAPVHPVQSLHPFFTTWHITFGTHAARLHGGPRLTVDRRHNQPGEPFIGRDPRRYELVQSVLIAPPVGLVTEQCAYIEAAIPAICDKGGWILRTCAASPPPDDGDHVHILLDAAPEAEPKVIRELLKRWLTQSLNNRWPPDRTAFQGWWAVGGSTKPVKDVRYLNNAFKYIEKQRMTRRA